jgi:hypothetical protein
MVETGAAPSGNIDQQRWTLRDPWALRDSTAAVLLFAATAGGILWQNAHVAVFYDISYMLNVATRIAGGQIPYRDFPLAHPPLTFLVQAAIIRLTGRVYFHHVLYVATIGGLSTLLAWRIALETLRNRIAHAWTIALLLAAPLVFLSVYSIMPNPEYDADSAFSILVAIWGLQRITCGDRAGCPTLAGSLFFRLGWVTNPSRSGNPLWSWVRAFLAGAALCVPMFFKQNMGLPFLLACICAIVFVLLASHFNRKQITDPSGSEARTALAALAGVLIALLAGALLLEVTAGLGNYLHWTIAYAGQRRMPGLDVMLGVYGYPALEWMLPCAIAGLVLLRTRLFKKVWAQIAAFLLLAAPFLFALAALFLYDDADSRGDSFLMIWPVLLVLATALALANLWRCWRQPSLRALIPLVLLAAINGAMMSQQLWGSTYGIWPLLVLLIAELFAVVDGFIVSAAASAQPAPRRFTLALAAFVSASMLVCGGFYTTSEERLSYAQFPDGPPLHSAFPALAGMATPGPFLPNLDELLRYAQANMPFNDGVMLMLGEDPFFFATGRAQPFPTTIWDITGEPYSPGEVAAMARTRNIRWLIVKTHPQLNEDPTLNRAATLDLLMKEFTLAAHLHGYDVYRANPAE